MRELLTARMRRRNLGMAVLTLVRASSQDVVTRFLTATHRDRAAAPRSSKSPLVFATAVVGSELLTETLKVVVARDRPLAVDRIGQAAQTFSLPSGHTLNSAVFLGLLVWTLWPAATRAVRAGALVGAVVPAVAVAASASRVYLGYHWLTDVLASALLATAILVTAAQLAARIARRGAPRKNESSATARAGGVG